MAKGMWTKMGAKSSTIVVAPKTISKDLEEKIRTCIEQFMSHGSNKDGGWSLKVVRLHVEKTLSLSLTDHKDVVKRLMHGCLQRAASKSESSASLEPFTIVKINCWKHDERLQSMRTGLVHLYQFTSDPHVFPQCSLDVIQHLCDLADVSQEPEIHRMAVVMARELASRWLGCDMHPGWSTGTAPSPLHVN
jgi:hypothetical protein